MSHVLTIHQGDMRSKVNALEEYMKVGLAGELLELPVCHHFAEGTYGRELFIPKGTLLTGKIHKYSQLNVLLCGDLSVLTEDGIKRVQPPFVIVSPPGTKRIAYAHEDTRWLTVHGTVERDLEKIEAHFIAQTDKEYADFCKLIEEGEQKCLGQQ